MTSSINVIEMAAEGQTALPERIGPYVIYNEIGSGGMASVHLGKLRSASGFTRIVAVKRMHPDLARSPDFVAMFFQEARLVGRIQHPNVVAALDCVAIDNHAMLVMEYVHGVSLHQIMRKSVAMPLPIASAILVGASLGLHAAHEAVDEAGKNLGIVHRDVSPHNILVGVDGLSRVLDFGIAKAAERAHHTRTGEVKGKIGYMAPEQLFGEKVGPEADVYSLGVVMWELMTGRRLFANANQGQTMMRIANSQIDSPRKVNPKIAPQIEAVVMKALSRSPEARYRSALDFAVAVESCIPPWGQRILGEWVENIAKDELLHRSALRAQIDLSMPGRVVDELEDGEITARYGVSRERVQSANISRTGVVRRRPKTAFLVTAASIASAIVAATTALHWSSEPTAAGASPSANVGHAPRSSGPIPSTPSTLAPVSIAPAPSPLLPTPAVPGTGSQSTPSEVNLWPAHGAARTHATKPKFVNIPSTPANGGPVSPTNLSSPAQGNAFSNSSGGASSSPNSGSGTASPSTGNAGPVSVPSPSPSAPAGLSPESELGAIGGRE